ncbi:hypothetical protein GWI33_014342 [Rhynchophorus ferrugineus]|uniref:PARG catalytic Macro domain-containing protein n=1 Tax=Rhynchophorus ferrugineus TaxID=354439 RepID=A0A834I7J5_RHYFE|nr:hypothetical protein GWI33_014342 [Rhynchophorus ferrugineus]
MPKWDAEERSIGSVKVHISSVGTIEDASGFLQVDFANKNIGGGVLRYGCVQEEIRFVICPELIVSRLFVEQLAQGEAVIITGVERFNNYTGYGDTFEYAGNHIDTTPHDLFGRRRTSLCVIDAVMFDKSQYQFQSSMILRELNKAFVGFSSREKENLAPVATGNWGCGAFNGSKMLKSLIQLMACAVAGRDLVYYSFGDVELVQKFYDMYLFLAENLVTVKQLWHVLRQLSISPIEEQRLYLLIKNKYFEQKRQPSISRFFSRNNTFPRSKTESDTIAPSSSNIVESVESSSVLRHSQLVKSDNGISSPFSSSSSDDVIPSSPQEPRRFVRLNNLKTPKKSADDIKDKLPDIDISAILEEVDSNANRSLSTPNRKEAVLASEDVIIPMEVDDVQESNFKAQKKKITDYFSKSNK